MKNALKRAASLVMTTVLLAFALLPSGCTSRAKDEEAIKETTRQFIDAFPTGDKKDIEELVDGDFSFDIKDKDRAELVFRAASKTEIIEYKNIEIDLSIRPTSEDPQIESEWYIFPLTVDDIFTATKITNEQELRCRQKAVEALYYAGEITEAQYKAYMEAIERDRNSASDPNSGNGYTVTEQDVNWSGTKTHTNQAVGVYEYLPDWSDGTLIYGASALDSNCIYMHYSKESDWYINGEQYGDTVKLTVEDDGTLEFEFTFSDYEIDRYSTCELRLWESGHSHVIAYVKLTKT